MTTIKSVAHAFVLAVLACASLAAQAQLQEGVSKSAIVLGQSLALTRQVALGLLAHRNVQVDAGDHQRRAARVALGDHAARMHPYPVTFPMLQPELGLVLARQAMQVCVEGLCHGRSVVRMHQAQE